MAGIYRILLCLLAWTAICLGIGPTTPVSAQTGSWPNEPPGFTTLLDCPLSGSLCGMWDAYNSATWAPGVNTPAPSTSLVLDQAMVAGSTQGNGQYGLGLQNLREIYFGTWWSPNAEFQGTINNTNKMIFFRNPSIDNSFIVWHGQPDVPKTLKWYFQAYYDNCHVPGYQGGCYNQGDGTGWLNPNVNAGAATIAPGSGWHRIELYLKSSTTATSRDGVLRMWVNGSMTHNYSTLNLLPLGANDFQFNTAWDGSAAYQCVTGRDCSRAWHHYYHNARISAGQGKGIVDQPAGPPAVPRILGVTTP